MRLSASFALLAAVAGLFIGCGGGSISSGTTPVAASSPLAYLLYPPSGPYAVRADSPAQFVIAVRDVDASYRLVLSPSVAATPTSFPLTFNPTSLPSPLASPPSGFTLAAVTLQTSLPSGLMLEFGLQPTTTYTVSLVGPQTIGLGTIQTDCGFPPPVPPPIVHLVSPSDGASDVSTTIGSLTIAGYPYGYVNGVGTIILTDSSGATIVSTAPVPVATSAASPVANPPQYVVRVPNLAGRTSYHVTLGYTDWSNVPPSCAAPATMPIGSFTTQ